MRRLKQQNLGKSLHLEAKGKSESKERKKPGIYNKTESKGGSTLEEGIVNSDKCYRQAEEGKAGEHAITFGELIIHSF